MSTIETQLNQDHEVPVKTEVGYLPATQDFRQEYDDETQLSTVRAQAMTFFGVSDHKDRDVHEFFLEFEGQRVTNLNQTLEQLMGRDRPHAKFNLVEQITPGAR